MCCDGVELSSLEDKLGYKFNDETLLINAVTHSSFANQNDKTSYERLEFLGDSVLSLLVSSSLYFLLSDSPPGELTRYKSFLVSCIYLSKFAESINLSDIIRVAANSQKDGLNYNRSIMEDVVEAIFGAIYVDGGLGAVKKVFDKVFLPKLLKTVTENEIRINFKAKLQEYSLKKYGKIPQYIVESVTGPPHMQKFEISVKINGEVVGIGIGKNKKKGEQAAAEFALEEIKDK